MRPPIPHVRLKYLIPLTIVTGLLTLSFIAWTSNYRVLPIPTFTSSTKHYVLRNKIPEDSKYYASLDRGHDSVKKKAREAKKERNSDIFGHLGRLKNEHFETEYQTQPPPLKRRSDLRKSSEKKHDNVVLSVEDEERMRRLFVRHRQMQKEYEKKRLEVFRDLAKRKLVNSSLTSSVAPPTATTRAPFSRDLKAKLHYHVSDRLANQRDVLIGIPNPRSAFTEKENSARQRKNMQRKNQPTKIRGVNKFGEDDPIELRYRTKIRPDSCRGCMRIKIPYIINPAHLCSANPHSIRALVLVFSEPGHEFVRETIRQTWGSIAERNQGKVRIAFLFGEILSRSDAELLREESVKYSDILVGGFVDSFRNLTLKTLMGLTWATNFCASARYVFKTDDDMWLNLPKFFTLEPRINFDRVVSGTCYDEAWHPHRDPESKYYVSYQEYSREDYPLLCTGTAYLMTMSVATEIVRVSPNVPFFHLEDVYVALCREKLGYSVLPLQGCFNYKELYDPCSYRFDVIASHWVTPDEMREAWTEDCKDPNDPITKYLRPN